MDDKKNVCPTCGGRRTVWTQVFGGWMAEPCPTCNADVQTAERKETAS
jgi:RNA polymerase subunit RPABC4/transcription elongation factor Spt4